MTRRPDQLSDPNLPAELRSLKGWFNAAAFAPVPAGSGRFGSAAKGTIKGPGVNCWDLGLYKQFSLAERLKLNTEISAINAFNHPNWSNPTVNISQTGNVGVVSSVGGVFDSTGARAFRFGLRMQR